MIIPAEAMDTTTGVLSEIREEADSLGLLDISMFPVQPWLDVAEHGFGVVATADGDARRAEEASRTIADRVWAQRERFRVPSLVTPAEAYPLARSSKVRPFLVAESADAPTAGAAGDSPAMIAAAIEHGRGLRTVCTVVDPAAVARCHGLGAGAPVTTPVGAGIDTRYWDPVTVEGVVQGVGAGSFTLQGVAFHGVESSMGRWAVIETPVSTILVSERPAMSADPSCYRHAGIDPFQADVLVVKSCSDFRPNYPTSRDGAVTLDVPGPATPRLDLLEFEYGTPWTPSSSN
jgi:microcystin degradation protein MlrC